MPMEVPKLLDDCRRRLAEREALERQTGRIDTVDPVSLEERDYRRTKLWQKIRRRVFARDGKTCRRCGGSATIVHHVTYDPPVMRGEDDSKLVALCEGCHTIVPFLPSGERRGLAEAECALADLDLNDLIPLAAMSVPFKGLRYSVAWKLSVTPRHPATWNRMTDVQSKAWQAEDSRCRAEWFARYREYRDETETAAARRSR